MTIEKMINGENTVLKISGRLDTQTAPQFEEALEGVFAACKELTLDMSALEYVSSAGLRVILKAQKIMKARGAMTLTHVNQVVMEIFEITGFDSILTIR